MDIQALTNLARAMAPALDAVTGTKHVTTALTAADTIMSLLDEIMRDEPSASTEFRETREQLEARVNAHADRTIKSLGD